jgi:hypothetical protein
MPTEVVRHSMGEATSVGARAVDLVRRVVAVCMYYFGEWGLDECDHGCIHSADHPGTRNNRGARYDASVDHACVNDVHDDRDDDVHLQGWFRSGVPGGETVAATGPRG